jgi:pyruvate dehydrogenase E2 component (dihydrolipoamide acetyltransferase)
MSGDVVCDIQTDKAVVSLEVDEEGVLAKIIKPADSGSIKVPFFFKCRTINQ